MDSMKYPKGALQARITENREAHRALFLKAHAGFRDELEARLEEFLEEVRRGEKVDAAKLFTIARLPIPEDRTGDYDAVLDMLAMSTDAQIELAEHEFRQYVRDEWGWKQQWLASAAMYTQGE